MDDLTKMTQEPPSWLELESVKPLTETRHITNLSPDTQKRQYPDYIVWLSERRCGMKLRHALDIAAGRIQPKSLRAARVPANNPNNEPVEKGNRPSRAGRPASSVPASPTSEKERSNKVGYE